MKWMVLLLAILAGVWLIKRQQLRGEQRGAQQPATPARRRLMRPKPMVACAHCGMHVPDDEAIAGQRGTYCSPAHRQAAEPSTPRA